VFTLFSPIDSSISTAKLVPGKEKYLNGKFTKFNSNNGYVNDGDRDGAVIDLSIGAVKLTDFVQAFSHWVYESTGHNLIVCDLKSTQGNY
jgi:hypothetical protein